MSIIEDASIIYYHGSRKEFPVGFTLAPQSDGYTAGSGDDIEDDALFQCEDVLERHRPAGAPKRSESVFMVGRPDEIDFAGGYDDFVYTVEPHGPVWKANLHWYAELYGECFDDVDDHRGEKLALAYWNAEPSGNSTLYEYLCSSAVVVEVME